MKRCYCFFLILVVGFTVTATAQITNLVVNDSSSNFTMVTGDTIHWEFDINPVGGAVSGRIWYDVNQNGVIDTLADKIRFAFTQRDGDLSGIGGVADMDGLANGHVVFKERLGLAPGKYVMKLSYNSDVHFITATITALSSPSHTISGTVTPPGGRSAQYLFVQAERGDNYEPNFWDAVTDVSGNYTIEIDSDTAGNPWKIRLSDGYNPFPPSIVTPSEMLLTISTPSYTGKNFSFQRADAQVAGYVHDESGNPLLNFGVFAVRYDGDVRHEASTNAMGFFQIGFSVSELDGQSWRVQTESNSGTTTTYLTGQKMLPAINSPDSLPVNLVVYSVNSDIQGLVLVDGYPPGFPLQMFASNNDSAQADTWADGLTGTFAIPVSDKIFNYEVYARNLDSNWHVQSVVAHPGDNGVIINIAVTSVLQREPSIPNQFSLKQNYPNPFNPSTTIAYDIASVSHVDLVVYDVLGREVARLVDQTQLAGKYAAAFDASKLSSGVYFYQLRAGTYSRTMKLAIVK